MIYETHARYIGWREDLKGRTALVRPRIGGDPARILVQFDFPAGQEFDEHGNPTSHDSLCYGWHDFATNQFETIPEGFRCYA